MPKFAANLTMLFNEVPFLDRFERAAKAGLQGGGIPVSLRLSGQRDQSRLERNGLELVLHNLPAGDWDGGERGIACLPDRVDEFRRGVAKAHRVRHGARRAAAQLPGRQGAGRAWTPPTLRRTFVANLRYAAGELRRAGLRLLIEPINSYDIPGFYLNRTAQALLDPRRGGRRQPVRAVRHLPRAAHGRRTGRDDAESTWRASRTSSWPTIRAATSRARARSTTPSCSRTSTASATPAGSAANTSPPAPPRPASAGASGSPS